ncbi:MAG: sugar ABC transporter permease [Propionicimonas sp.]
MVSVKGRSIIVWFLLPALLIYTLFTIAPLAGTVAMSFTDWPGFAGAPLKFNGLANYQRLFADAEFWRSMTNLIQFVVVSVAIHIPVGLLLATLLSNIARGYRFFRTSFFMPFVMPLTAVSLLWCIILLPNDQGLLNAILNSVGLGAAAHGWLIEPGIAMISLAMVNGWVSTGFFTTILFAGIMQIPQSITESAILDGAGPIKRFATITMPLLRPVIGTCLILDLTGSIKVFDLVFVMTKGGPNGLTQLPTTYMYDEAFKNHHFGVGSAAAVAIIVLSLIATILSVRLVKDESN